MASRDAKLCRQAGRRDQRETQRTHGVQTGRRDDVGIVAISAQNDRQELIWHGLRLREANSGWLTAQMFDQHVACLGVPDAG